jgi:hypothetical protein
MNEYGEGIIAWSAYFGEKFFVRTFRDAGQQLNAVQEISHPDGINGGNNPWVASVAPNGNYVLAWPTFAEYPFAKSYMLLGHVDDQSPQPVVSAPGFATGGIALNNAGYMVTMDGSNIQVLSPERHVLGKTVPLTSMGAQYSKRQLNGISLDGNRLTVRWSATQKADAKIIDLVEDSFNLRIQPELTLDALTPPSEMQAGQVFAAQFTLRNSAVVASLPSQVTFYLSHDSTVDRRDRFLGTTSVTALAAGASASMSGNLRLPIAADPFWRAGTTNLQLIALVENSGYQLSTSVPYVSVVIPPPPTPPGGFDAPTDPDPPVDPLPEARPKYIRPNIALDQLPSQNIVHTIDLMEIVGYQLLTALDKLYDQAPQELKPTIDSLRSQAKLRIETFVERKYTAINARALQEAEAQEKLTAAIDAANRNRQQALADAKRIRDAEIALRSAELAKHDAQLVASQKAARDEYSRKEAEEWHKVDLIDQAIDQHLASASGVVDSVRSFFENPSRWFNDRLEELYDARDRAFDAYVDARDGLLADLTAAKESARHVWEEATKLPIKLIAKARTVYEDAERKALETGDRLVEDAQEVFESTIVNIPDLADVVDNVKTATKPIFSRIGGVLEEGYETIAAPGGILDVAHKALEDLPFESPFVPSDFIPVAGQVAGDIAESVLGDIRKIVDPPITILKKAGGDFADWGKETGGKISDWTKEAGADAAKWVAEHGDDVLDFRLWRFVVREGPTFGPTVEASQVAATYEEFRNQLFGEPNKLELADHLKSQFVDVGKSGEDHALKNGLALIAAALEGEHDLALRLLNEFIEQGFDEKGEPIRLLPPDFKGGEGRNHFFEDGGGRDNYSVDQFIPQLVGIHFAWNNGNTAVRQAAKKLMTIWISVLNENGGRLGPDDGVQNEQFDQTLFGVTPAGSAYGSPILPSLVESVAAEMGMTYNAELAFSGAIGDIRTLLRDWIVDALGRCSWVPGISIGIDGRPILPRSISLPMDLRRAIADVVVSPITALEHVLAIPAVPTILDVAFEGVPDELEPLGWRSDIQQFIYDIFPFGGLGEVLLFAETAVGYGLVSASYAAQGSGAVATTGHLFFWQALLYDDLYPRASALLQPLKVVIQAATAQHRWLNYDLLAGKFAEPVDKLLNWPASWRNESYMFKQNRKDQDDKFNEPLRSEATDYSPEKELDQLGYLVLHALAKHFGALT